MEIPQGVLDKFVVRSDYLDWIQGEQAIFVYLDLANMLHWQDVLSWRFRIEDLIAQLYSYPSIKEIKVYYGLNGRDFQNSKAFHKRISKTGAILRTKPMKFIKKEINSGLFFQRKTMASFDGHFKVKVEKLIRELNDSGMIIEEPKCNFDVEMAMDILDDSEKSTAIILFSGDSDMVGPLERLKIKGKKIGVCGVRNNVSKELHDVKDKYFDFGKLYTGKKNYSGLLLSQKAKIPQNAGPRE